MVLFPANQSVFAGLDPAIHAVRLSRSWQSWPQRHGVDGWDKPGQDSAWVTPLNAAYPATSTFQNAGQGIGVKPLIFAEDALRAAKSPTRM